MAGFFIDIGVLDPKQPERYLLGVECDGAAYHSSRYARDRDRLRQQILEARGWKLHRIWSTDWFYRRAREIEKLRAAIAAAEAGRPLPSAASVYDYEPMEEPELPISERAGEGVDEDGAEVEADRPTAHSLRPYEFADFRHSSSEPHTLSDRQLAEIAERIVNVEQPIHEGEVARRLAHVCGLQRAGSRIQDAASRGLAYAMRDGRLASVGPFWTRSGDNDPPPRTRAQLPAAEMVRKPEMISPAELAAAATIALENNLALPRDELITETARLIGLARVGEYVRSGIETAIETLGNKVEEDHMGRLKLKT